MKYLETILNFLTTLARIIFPRRKRPVTGDNLCPDPLPQPPQSPLPLERGNGNSPDSLRRNPLPPAHPKTSALEADWLGLSGYTLMLLGGTGYLLKYWL